MSESEDRQIFTFDIDVQRIIGSLKYADNSQERLLQAIRFTTPNVMNDDLPAVREALADCKPLLATACVPFLNRCGRRRDYSVAYACVSFSEHCH